MSYRDPMEALRAKSESLKNKVEAQDDVIDRLREQLTGLRSKKQNESRIQGAGEKLLRELYVHLDSGEAEKPNGIKESLVFEALDAFFSISQVSDVQLHAQLLETLLTQRIEYIRAWVTDLSERGEKGLQHRVRDDEESLRREVQQYEEKLEEAKAELVSLGSKPPADTFARVWRNERTSAQAAVRRAEIHLESLRELVDLTVRLRGR